MRPGSSRSSGAGASPPANELPSSRVSVGVEPETPQWRTGAVVAR